MSSKGGTRWQLHRDHCLVKTLVSRHSVSVEIKNYISFKALFELL